MLSGTKKPFLWLVDSAAGSQFLGSVLPPLCRHRSSSLKKVSLPPTFQCCAAWSWVSGEEGLGRMGTGGVQVEAGLCPWLSVASVYLCSMGFPC